MQEHRILFISNSADFFVSHRIKLAKRLNDAGYKISLLVPSTSSKSIYDFEWLDVEEFYLKRNSKNILHELCCLISIFKAIRSIKPSVVHSLTIKPNLYSSIIAKFLKFHHVIAITGLGFIHNPISTSEKIFSKIILYPMKFILSRNGTYVFQNTSDMKKISELLGTDKFNFIETYGSGVNLNLFREINYKDNNERIDIAFAGRLIRDKGINIVKEIANHYNKKNSKKLLFHIFGAPDPMNPRSITQDQLNEIASLPNIKYHGHVNNIYSYLPKYDIFLYPSTYGEGVPKVLLEAAASGLALITSNIAGCKKVNLDSVNGVVINNNDFDDFIRAIEEFISNKNFLKNAKIKSREIAIEKFSEEDVFDKHLDMYNSIFTGTRII